MKSFKASLLGITITLFVTGCAQHHEITEPGMYVETGTQARISHPGSDEKWIENKNLIHMSAPDGTDVLIDIPFRIVGVAGTIAGAAVFVGTSPLTGLATAIPPYNAINKAAETLVVEPSRWTFERPIGIGPVMPGMSDSNVYGHYESRKTWKQ